MPVGIIKMKTSLGQIQINIQDEKLISKDTVLLEVVYAGPKQK